MGDINVPMLLFSGGEIGKEAQARIDLEIYASTAEVMENVLPLMQGGMTKVAGTEFITALADNTKAIVRPFIYNVDETRTLQIRAGEIKIVDGDALVGITGAAATIGAPLNNASTGGASVSAAGQDITFTALVGGEARAYWPVTAGVNGSPTTFRFSVGRRPIKIRIGTTTSAEDILSEITLDPGEHVITFTPTATTYYFRARLTDEGKATLTNLQREAPGALTITTPYLADDLQSLRIEQSNDVIWFYHPDYQTRVLERRADTSWGFRLFRPSTGPFEVLNLTATTLTPTVLTGSGLLNASTAMFSALNVGQLFQLEHKGQREELNATAVSQASEAIRVTGLEDENRAFAIRVSGTFVGSVTLQRSAGNDIDWIDVTTYSAPASAAIIDELPNQIIYYRFVCDGYTSGTIECELIYAGGATTGRCEVVAYVSPTQVEIEVLESFGALTATALWNEGSWSDGLGWPAAGGIDEARHVLGRGDRYFAGESDDYEGFELGVDAADAISRRIGVGGVNSVRWIETGDQLLIGTSGGEIRISSNAFEEPITPLNIKARAFGDEGSADAQAVKAGTRVVFIDRTRAKLIQCYENENGKMDTDDLCRLHEKIAGEIAEGTDNGFVEVAYQRRPQPRIWAVRSDGQIGVILFAPKEGVYGWCRVTGASGGLFKSVCVIPGSPEDRVHVIVEREIDGFTVTYHERFAPQRFAIETDDDGNVSAPAAWRLQCALSSDGEATTSFSGLDHLEGETVRVWGDGRDAGSYEVVSGAITTNAEIEFAIIGLNYTGKWKSSKLAYGARMGTALTMEKKVNRLGVVVHETPVGAVTYGRTFETATDGLSEYFEAGMTMDAPVTLWSQEHNQPFDGASDIDSRICLVMDGPAPATVLALVPSLGLEETG